MSEEEFEIYEAVSTAVRTLVDLMLDDLPEESEDTIRDRLTEQFRFWRQQ